MDNDIQAMTARAFPICNPEQRTGRGKKHNEQIQAIALLQAPQYIVINDIVINGFEASHGDTTNGLPVTTILVSISMSPCLRDA